MNTNNILETIKMIEEERLDVRTITMGISLLDCIDPNGDKARIKIYDKITKSAERLVEVGRQIESEFGIPIVNKRVSVTPMCVLYCLLLVIASNSSATRMILASNGISLYVSPRG